MRGVGAPRSTPPPYAPSSPQPKLSIKMSTMLGLSSLLVAATALCGVATAATVKPASMQPAAAHLRGFVKTYEFCFKIFSITILVCSAAGAIESSPPQDTAWFSTVVLFVSLSSLFSITITVWLLARGPPAQHTMLSCPRYFAIFHAHLLLITVLPM